MLNLFKLFSLIFGTTGIFLLVGQLFEIISSSFSTQPILIIIGILATILGIASYFYHKKIETMKNRIDDLETYLDVNRDDLFKRNG